MKKTHMVFVAEILLFVVFISGCTNQKTLNEFEEIKSQLEITKSDVASLSLRLDMKTIECESLQNELDIKSIVLADYEELEINYSYMLDEYEYQIGECNEFFNENQYIESSYDSGHKFFIDSEIEVFEIECTGSMEPTMYCGDIVLVYKPKNFNDIERGDIITFWDGYDNVIHRVVSKNRIKGTVKTQGDNNPVTDDFRPTFSDIKYKVIGIIFDH